MKDKELREQFVKFEKELSKYVDFNCPNCKHITIARILPYFVSELFGSVDDYLCYGCGKRFSKEPSKEPEYKEVNINGKQL